VDIEKAMEFILEQQAALTASIQQLQAEGARHQAEIERHSRDLEVHTGWKIEMSRALQGLASQMQEAFREMARHHNALADRMAELAAHQKRTDENLSSLVRTVQDILPRLPGQ
jgi:prefoldin subunit 5